MPSFDIVSKIDKQELDNALNQATKEISQRFDFRGTDTKIEKTDAGILIESNTEGRLDAAWDVLAGRLVRRGLPLEAFKRDEVQPAARGRVKQLVRMQEGIPQDDAKKIVKRIKDQKLKVQAQIQGDSLRVSGKKRDDLQAVIKMLKEAKLGIAMQFVNFRD
ncbi:MAG: YajQ family cyclic di-GMP-binding protein [Deltaproteobacteria bacterium]|nr:MAG: YajQ family cyclic di-GMP-binding protein [Deltaproteobacteria bacterium]